MLLPLVVMGGAALNDSRFPSVYPWVGFTDRWFVELWNDARMWIAFRNTLFVALAVVVHLDPDRHRGGDPDQQPVGHARARCSTA